MGFLNRYEDDVHQDALLDEPSMYFTSQWQKSEKVSRAYLCYRYFVALWSVGVVLASFFSPESRSSRRQETFHTWKWFIYLTNWGYSLIVVQALLGLYLTQKAFFRQRAKAKASENIDLESQGNLMKKGFGSKEVEGRPVGWVAVLYRGFFAAAASLAFFITSLYWVLIFDPDYHVMDTLNILMHGCNSLVMLSEVCLVRLRAELKDALAPFLVGFLYTVFSSSYYAAGGLDRFGRPFVYPRMDWSNWRGALLFSVESEVGVVLAHLLLLLMQLARRTLHRKITSRRLIVSIAR